MAEESLNAVSLIQIVLTLTVKWFAPCHVVSTAIC